ncbi:hypothetical protein QLX08_010266 [Tetragonisca angustula]|uniref:Uncharacterized protein n=1 Tax=Tetragonisca angustula TaxID=166442 RepID=A0AAW0ZD00_9HYME
MLIQNRKRRAICNESEVDSGIENALNNNMNGKKHVRKLQRILNSSESSNSDCLRRGMQENGLVTEKFESENI